MESSLEKFKSKLNINGNDIAHRIQSEKEIRELIDYVMANKQFLSFDDFKELTLKKTSDWFLIVN